MLPALPCLATRCPSVYEGLSLTLRRLGTLPCAALRSRKSRCKFDEAAVLLTQERAKELAAHEEQLEDWKKRFKAEALRQISEREKALTEWQGQLEGSRTELEHLKENMEVAGPMCCCLDACNLWCSLYTVGSLTHPSMTSNKPLQHWLQGPKRLDNSACHQPAGKAPLAHCISGSAEGCEGAGVPSDEAGEGSGGSGHRGR